MSGNLENLVKIGKLKVEPFSETEFKGLVTSASKRLADASERGTLCGEPFRFGL